MNRSLKKVLATGLMVVGLGWMGQKAEAVGPNPDSMIVSVTPGGTQFGVYITSVNANGYQFGTVNLGETTVSTAAIVVKSSGTVSEYFAMSVTSDGGADAWSPLSADGTPAHNEFELLGRFQVAQAGEAAFDTTDDIVDGSVEASAGKYNQGSLGKTAPGNTQNLWLMLKMPGSVSSSSQRLLTLAITGRAD
jgi:hypothetical protein